MPSKDRSQGQRGARWGLRWVPVLVTVGAGVMGPGAVWATHEVEHRFVVSGSVRMDDGTPRPDVKVVVAHPKSQLSETVFTDRNGEYSALLHLHDRDAGDPVTVTVGDEVKTIKAAYTPGDHHTPRTARVDFGLSVAGESSDHSMAWWYGIGGGVALAGGLLYWRYRAKPTSRRRREARRPSQKTPRK